MKLLCMILHWWVHIIIYVSKPIECTTSRVNLNVNYELWVIMMCQCIFINCNKCTTLMRDVDEERGYVLAGEGIYGKSSYLPLSFAVNLKLLLKIKPAITGDCSLPALPRLAPASTVSNLPASPQGSFQMRWQR